MTAEVFRFRDYMLPRDMQIVVRNEGLCSVVILPVVRIERGPDPAPDHDPEPRRRRRRSTR